jgi:hypothetical protein
MASKRKSSRSAKRPRPNAERFAKAIELRGSIVHFCGDRRGELLSRALDDEASEFLARRAIPAPLRALLEAHSYKSTVTFGNNRFSRVNRIVRGNKEPMVRMVRCLQEGLLVVGSGPGGDPIVVDLENDGAISFISHDLFFEDHALAARETISPTPFDLGSFFLADALFAGDCARDNDEAYARSHRTFPVDSYAAAAEAESGWDIFEDGLCAWEDGEKRLPGLSYPLAFDS